MSASALYQITSPADILAVSDMAGIIWREHYGSILCAQQIEYMLKKFQSPDAITQAVDDGYEYYFIDHENIHVGYLAIKIDHIKQEMFLSKIYLLAAHRGKGYAFSAMDRLADICKLHRLNLIWLTVNKDNPSIAAYKKMGFAIAGSMVTDIGNGFVMDDYRMEKLI